jgi:spore coat polysaccharide biosynthesis protein SpsF
MRELKIVTVIQARTGSSRLPKKVLLSICGKSLLIRMVERVNNARLAGRIVIATSTNGEDDPIEELCASEGLDCFRGNPTDLLDRHYKAGLHYGADAVAKIPSDCPLIDPTIIDKVYTHYLSGDFDYVSNLHPASYPDGNDVEIFSFAALESAWKEAEKNFEREHTTPFFWERPERFRLGNVKWETRQDFSSSHRFTIDYEEDYIFIRTVFDELYSKKPDFGLYDILRLLDEKPYIKNINGMYAGKYWYDNHINELNNIVEYKSKRKNND